MVAGSSSWQVAGPELPDEEEVVDALEQPVVLKVCVMARLLMDGAWVSANTLCIHSTTRTICECGRLSVMALFSCLSVQAGDVLCLPRGSEMVLCDTSDDTPCTYLMIKADKRATWAHLGQRVLQVGKQTMFGC